MEGGREGQSRSASGCSGVGTGRSVQGGDCGGRDERGGEEGRGDGEQGEARRAKAETVGNSRDKGQGEAKVKEARLCQRRAYWPHGRCRDVQIATGKGEKRRRGDRRAIKHSPHALLIVQSILLCLGLPSPLFALHMQEAIAIIQLNFLNELL